MYRYRYRWMYVYIQIYICIYVYICIDIYVCIYIYVHTHIHTHLSRAASCPGWNPAISSSTHALTTSGRSRSLGHLRIKVGRKLRLIKGTLQSRAAPTL